MVVGGSVVCPRAQAQDRWPEDTAQEGLFMWNTNIWQRRGFSTLQTVLWLHLREEFTAQAILLPWHRESLELWHFRRWSPWILGTVQGQAASTGTAVLKCRGHQDRVCVEETQELLVGLCSTQLGTPRNAGKHGLFSREWRCCSADSWQ